MNLRTKSADRPRAAAGALALGLALACAACKSSGEFHADADAQVYKLVLERRAKLAFDGSFTIDPATDSLRKQFARGEVSKLEPLSFVRCLELAAENSRDYQTRKESLYLAALDLTLERWRLAVQEHGVFGAEVDGTGDTANTVSGNGGFSLSKLLGSGATIVGNIGLNMLHTLTFSDGWHPRGSLGLSITQPLLRGFGARIVKEPLTQAERNLVYQVRSFERFRRTFAVDTANRYYRLLETANAIDNQEVNYNNLVELSKRNKALAEAGRLSDIEVGQAKQNELTSHNDLISTQARLASDLDDLKLFMGLPMTLALEIDHGELERLAQQPIPEVQFPEEAALRFALEQRLDHQTVRDQLDDAARHVDVAADALRGGLKLEASANVLSADGQPGRFNFQDTSWLARLTWDLPLERMEERNSFRKAEISRQAAERAVDASQDGIENDVRDELRQAQLRKESFAIQEKAVELANRRIESTLMLRDAGRADTRTLLEAEASLLQSQNAATTALIEALLARFALFRDIELVRVDAQGIHADESLVGAAAAGGAIGPEQDQVQNAVQANEG